MVKQKQIISQLFAPGVREVAILCVCVREIKWLTILIIFILLLLSVKKRLKTNFMLLMSPHNYKVVDAMAHAAVCRRPKLRYSVGLDHKVIWKPLSFLPSELQDLLLEYC